nr:TonB-dependent receptor [uncultured Hyphomonas sp.]
MSTQKSLRLASASVVAILGGMALYAPARAQTTETDDGDLVQETVLVTGYAAANRDSIEAKRDSDLVIDAISQDDIGLLPDLTISDVARRIPGVTTVSVDGVAGTRSVNSEQNVVIRGLSPDFNLTTFDGVPIASTSENSRAANLSIFPPTVVRRIEATKTLTSDLNPHGLSGQLNLVTTSAFDRDEAFFSSRFSMGRDSTADKGPSDGGNDLRGSAVYSTAFGDNDQFGIVASGSYEQFYYSSYDNRAGGATDTYLFYSDDTTSDDREDFFEGSVGYPAARQNQLYVFDGEKERASGVLKLEYAPHGTTYASLFLGVFYQNEEETRYEYQEIGDPKSRPLDQTPASGTWARGQVDRGYVYQPEESLTTVVTGKFQHDFGGHRELDLVGSFSHADVDVIRNMSKFQAGYSADTAFSYEFVRGRPQIDFANPDVVNDLTRYENNYIRERSQDIEQDLFYLSAAYADNFEAGSQGFGYRVGASFTDSSQDFDRGYIEGDVFDANGDLVTMDNYVLDNTRTGNDRDVIFYFIDDQKLRADWLAQGQTITNDRSDNAVRDDYSLSEQIMAAYGQLSWRTERMSILAGFRYDRTEADVSLYARDDRLDDDPDDAAQYVPLSRSTDYDFLLPSIIGSFDLTDNAVLRVGYSRTIGRPTYGQISQQERYGDPDLNIGVISVSRGNPDLKPLVSDNFDLSGEYYFDSNQSMVSLAAFYKEVSDLIYKQKVIDPNFVYEGNTLKATISQPINATDASIYGLEFSVRKDFSDTLPAPLDGLVLDANITWIGSEFAFINSEGDERDPGGWEDQPELLANVQLSYEKGPFGAKIGYNYVGSFLSSILADEGDIYDMYRDPRDVWDTQVRYNLTDSLRLVAEIQNLTEEGVDFTRDIPGYGELYGASVERGRTVWLGFSWTPGL